MDRDAGEPLRWLRGLLLATVTMAAGVGAHVTAAGRLPDPVTLGALFNLLLLVQVAWLGRPASTVRITSLLLGGQTAIHLALTVTAGHHHVPDEEEPGLLAHLAGEFTLDNLPMMVAHLAAGAAGAAVAVWLGVGERALWTVLGLAGRLVLRVLVALRALGAVPLVRPVPVPDSAPVNDTGLRFLSCCVVRRGPPLLLAA